jgi:hypothetical protein
MPYNALKMKDWQISEAAEKNIPNRRRCQDREDQRIVLSEVRIWDLTRKKLCEKTNSVSPLVVKMGAIIIR